jgi:hypothetical protein
LIEDARDPLLASLLTDNNKGISERDLDDSFLLEPEDEQGRRDVFGSASAAIARGGFGSGASGSVLRDGLRSGEAQPDELQAAGSARVAAERQLRECREEANAQRQKADVRLQEEVTQREAADARYKELEASANTQREELEGRLQRADEHARQMTKEIAQLKEGQHQAAAAAFDQPLQRGADAAGATVPDRRLFDTQQSAGLRAADPSALVGKTIEVGGEKGVVKAVVAKTGGSTLHTVDFGGGKVETIHLAKRAGGKGAKFHIAGEGEGAASGPLGGSGSISYHAAATPDGNKSRSAHRAGRAQAGAGEQQGQSGAK